MTENRNAHDKDRGRRFSGNILPVFAVLCLAAVLVFALIRSSNTYDDFTIIQTINRGDNTSAYYHEMSRGMLRYSKDGAAMTDRDGNILWNKAFQMNSVISSTNDTYVAIGAESANDIYIFDENGETGHVITDMPISDLVVSQQGVVAVMLSDTGGNYINMYDKTGKNLVSIRVTLDHTGYPVALDLSPDATKLAVSYLVISAGKVQSRIIFYNFADSSSEYVQGDQTFDGLYPKLSFVTATRVVLFGEDGFKLYDLSGAVSELRSLSFEDEIKSVFCGNEKIGFIFRNADENGTYRIEIYDYAGQLNSASYTDFEYYSLTMGDGEIMLYNDHRLVIYEYGGRKKFDYDLNFRFMNVYASWQENQYWLVSEKSLSEIRLE